MIGGTRAGTSNTNGRSKMAMFAAFIFGAVVASLVGMVVLAFAYRAIRKAERQ